MIPDAFVCGAHSNIPLCCQIFYDSVWTSLRKKTLPKGHYKEIEPMKYAFVGDWYHGNHEYVMCPECMIRVIEGRQKPHKVKPCECAHKSA